MYFGKKEASQLHKSSENESDNGDVMGELPLLQAHNTSSGFLVRNYCIRDVEFLIIWHTKSSYMVAEAILPQFYVFCMNLYI